MKMSKKLLSIVLALAMLVSTIACLATVNASAEDPDNVAYSFESYYRHYGWGEWPKTVNYTENGYCEFKDTGRFTRQVQLMFWANDKFDQLMKVCQATYDDANALAIDFNIVECMGSNAAAPQVNAAEMSTMITFSYYDPDDPDAYINDEDPEDPKNGRVSYDTHIQSWLATDSIGSTVTKKLGVDTIVEAYADYEDFRFDKIRLGAMNYANNAFKTGDYTGQAGLGFLDIYFSPIYIFGTTVPEKGADLGLDVELEERDGKMWFKEWEQGDQDTYGKDGPYGNGADIVREAAPTVIYGDVNADEAVNAKDVLLLKQYFAQWKVTIDEAASDVNADDAVNAKDLLKLRQYLADWEVVLGQA